MDRLDRIDRAERLDLLTDHLVDQALTRLDTQDFLATASAVMGMSGESIGLPRAGAPAAARAVD